MKTQALIINQPNKNGRIYSMAVIIKAIAKYKAEFIDHERAFVTQHIPLTFELNVIDVVASITELKIEDNELIAEVKFIPDVREALTSEAALANGSCHLRTSGVGTLHKTNDGNYIVGDDYELTSCFLTYDPA
jgi:hypothetical protein